MYIDFLLTSSDKEWSIPFGKQAIQNWPALYEYTTVSNMCAKGSSQNLCPIYHL